MDQPTLPEFFQQPIIPSEQNQLQQLPKVPTKATCNNFNEKFIIFSQPILKKVPSPKDQQDAQEQTYHQIVLSYNYGLGDFPVVDEFFFEFCEVTTSQGLVSKLNMQRRMEHSILIKFDATSKENDKVIDCINRIYSACVLPIFNSRGIIRLPEFDAQRPAALFKNPVYRPRDKLTLELLEGRALSMYLKCFTRGTYPYIEQTTFTHPGDTKIPISWEMLRFAEIKFIPLVQFKNIYCGTKASIQMEMVSAIVTKITPRGGSRRQDDTAAELRESRPELADSVAAQVARMAIDRQDQILAAETAIKQNSKPTQSNQSSQEQPQQSTFNGITATNQRQQYQQSPQQQYQQSPQQYQQQPSQQYQQQPPPQQYQQYQPPQIPPPQQGYQNTPPNIGGFTNSAPERQVFA